jgi:cell division protein FtsQ
MPINSTHIKKIAIITLWLVVASAGVFLLMSGRKRQSDAVCKSIQINIHGEGNHFFIDKTDVMEMLKRVHGQNPIGARTASINIKKMEQVLKQDQWIERAELFFDKNDRLVIEIEEKNPVARVFTTEGNSFYLDHQLRQLPLTNRHAVRLPVFTGFPTGAVVLSKADSNLLNDIHWMSMHISKDAFLMAMIDQININAQREFELIPKLGDQLILFGSSRDMEKKFRKLQLFYQQALPVFGWSRYQQINLKFNDQVVASLRGKEDIQYDSLLTMRMIKAMADYSARKAADTTQGMIQDNEKNSVDVSMVMTSFVREEPTLSTAEVNMDPPLSTSVNKSVETKGAQPIQVKKIQPNLQGKLKTTNSTGKKNNINSSNTSQKPKPKSTTINKSNNDYRK